MLRDRVETLDSLAESAMMFYGNLHPDPELLEKHVTHQVRPALEDLKARFSRLAPWTESGIDAEVKAVIAVHGLKMPAVALPLRVMVFGLTQTPSLGAVLELAGRERTLGRMERYLGT